MIRYHFDLYPRDDPKNGVRLVRFTKLQSAEYRGEANGTGSGRFSIRADTAEAQNIDPAGLQYVRVVREDTVAVTEAVVGGFFLDSGDFTALDERGTRLLQFGGAGTLSYLARAIMASHTYISPIFTGQDPFDDTWRLYAQSTVYANGNYLGAMLWRVIYEAQHNTPGTHRHADGVNVSDVHDDDRPAIAIPDLVMNFDQFNDSNSNAWTVTSGEFKAQVGENVLQVVKRLMEAGLYVEMDPDTFELNAYPASTHGRDRTGASWGASVVRFQAPSDETIDTGNIKSDAKRAISAFIKRSWLLAGGSDTYGDATGTTDIPWEGFYYSDTADATALAGIAGVQIGARDDAGDTARLRIKLGTDTSNGAYRPFEDILLDDLVTVHTGTGQWDWNEQDFPVAAITVTLRAGGDWDAWVELGSSYSATPGRQFQVSPVAAHNHPPNPRLCEREQSVATLVSAGYLSGGTGAGSYSIPDGLTDSMLLVVGFTAASRQPFTGTLTVGSGGSAVNHPLTVVPSSSLNTSLGGDAGIQALYLLNPPTSGVAEFPVNSLQILDNGAGGTWKGVFLIEGVNQSNPFAGVELAEGSGATASVTVSGGGLQVAATAARESAAGSVGPTAETGTQAWTNTFGNTMEFGGSYGAAAASFDFPGSRNWLAIGMAINGSSSGGDSGPMPVGANDEADHGTSNRATRCDHVHPHSDLSYHSDETHHHASSVEVTPFDTIAATNVQDALEELLAESAGTDLTGIDFLVGTASGDLSAEIVVGTTPGGELGGTWASPTVNAVHSGSAHLALGTTAGTAAEGNHTHAATIPTGYYRPVMDGYGNVITDSGTGAALMAYAED